MNIENLIRHDIWGAVDKQLIWAYRGTVEPTYQQTWVGKYFYALWYIVEGGVVVETSREEFSANKGDFMLVPACVHTQNFSTNTDLVSVRFMLNGPDGGPLLAVDQPIVLLGDCSRLVNVCFRLSNFVEKTYKVKNDRLNT
ncbi:MAG: hypothetical protein PF795_15255, partial [Kiritimatiellae bacterium]|nr:hypothetical protein [Kiritimatiellia bacterium]